MPSNLQRRGARLSTDERRGQLLRAGIELLGKRPYDQVSISDIAAAAGVSKGLLYHYFPTKTDFVLAALEEANAQLLDLTLPDPARSPAEQVDAGLDAFLRFVEEHSTAYEVIFRNRGAGTDEAIQAKLEAGRQERIEMVLASIQSWRAAAPPLASPALAAAVQGWIFFVEGSVLHWIEDRSLTRGQVRELLRRTFFATLEAAAAVDPQPAEAAPGEPD